MGLIKATLFSIISERLGDAFYNHQKLLLLHAVKNTEENSVLFRLSVTDDAGVVMWARWAHDYMELADDGVLAEVSLLLAGQDA